MKRMALPLIGALICLQFTAGCLETGQKQSGMRAAGGREHGLNAKEAAKRAAEGSITEKAFDFKDDNAFRILIEPILLNISAQQKDALGLERIVSARKWATLSLYGKSIPANVYYAPTVKGQDGQPISLAWMSTQAVQINKSVYDSYGTQEQATILMSLLVTTLRLETKGILGSYDALTSASAAAATLEAQNATVDGAVASAAVPPTETQDPSTLSEGTDQSQNSEAVANDETKEQIASGGRRTLPVDQCQDPDLDQAELNACLANRTSVDDKKRASLLSTEDLKNIEEAVKYLLQSGRSETLDNIKKKLQALTIIK